MKCRFCNSKDIKVLREKINDYSQCICNSCKLEFFILDNNKNITNELYENDSDYSNDLNISLDYNSLIQWNHLKAFDFIKKQKFDNILDLGAYNGFFVKYLLEKDLNSFGYDFNENAVNHGIKTYNLQDRLMYDLNALDVKKFDCITAFEIIEHLENPNDLISQIKELLEDDGYVIISSPNNKMMWRPPLDTPPHHVLRVNPETLANYLKLNGFEIIIIHEQMSTFDLIRNSVGLLFRDKNSNSLKGGDFKDKNKANFLKKILNKIRPLACLIFKPIDAILYLVGFRYISQVVIAQRINEKN